MNIDNIVDQAVEAAVNGSSLQSTIREIFETDSYPLDTAVDVVSSFKNRTEAMISSNDIEQEATVFRKTVNNIINDISRMARKYQDHSIVCVKKKPEYVYEAREWTPAQRSAVVASGTTTIVSTPAGGQGYLPITDEQKEEIVLEACKGDPELIIATLFNYHDHDKLGELFLAELKRAKSRKSRAGV